MATLTLSHYELLERIAEGGMGVVYKARDTRLRRLVALKLVSPDLKASPEDVERLFDEARAISQLNHPNVATVFEVDRSADEPFMAMEYLPGGTLRAKLRKAQANGGRFEVRQIVDYATQIGKGLAHAHRHGIIHRDIKADNVLFSAEGEAKLSDFGVAQVAGRSVNGGERVTVGTAAYMSPEQAQGLETNHRSDIFSFGILLYEMAAGRMPFDGPREEVILYDIVNSPAPPLREQRGDLPARFYQTVDKALEKNPEARYESVDALLEDLRLVSKELSMADTKSLRAQPTEPTIAVLPFVDMSPDKDQEYFCDGITEEIINGLTSVKGLKVVSRTSSFRFKQAAYDIRDIGQQLGVQTVVEGSVRKVGNRFRITAQHIDVASGYHLWSRRFDREMSDLFVVQDEIAQAIVDNLRSHLMGEVPKQIVKKHTENIEAYNLYLEGRFHLNQRTSSEIYRSIECFEKACCEDCGFAVPYAGLAEACILLGSGGYPGAVPEEWYAKARQSALQAIEKDDSCAEAHVALALVYYRADWDWEKAEREFRRGLELNDGYATGHHQYAMFLASLLRLDEALEHIQKAHGLDPLSPIISTAVGRVLDFARRHDEAIEQCGKTVEQNPQFAAAYFDLGVACLHKGAFEEAKQAVEKLSELSGERIRELIIVGGLHALRGERTEALVMLKQVEDLSQHSHFSFVGVAILYVNLGDLDKAFELIEESYRRREPALVYLQVEPTFDPLRSDPRYSAMLAKMGLPTPKVSVRP